jgi:hypothetical protein
MANIVGIQILGMLFGIFMMYYTFLYYKRKEFTIREYSFWLVFWGIFVLITLFPQVLDPILVKLNIVRALDFFMIAGFLFVIIIVVHTYMIVRKNQRKIEEVVRNIALRKK